MLVSERCIIAGQSDAHHLVGVCAGPCCLSRRAKGWKGDLEVVWLSCRRRRLCWRRRWWWLERRDRVEDGKMSTANSLPERHDGESDTLKKMWKPGIRPSLDPPIAGAGLPNLGTRQGPAWKATVEPHAKPFEARKAKTWNWKAAIGIGCVGATWQVPGNTNSIPPEAATATATAHARSAT
jgi:hypothetical protein